MPKMTGTTGNSYVNVYNETAEYGLARVAAVKNEAMVNSLTMRVRQEDCWGGDEQSEEFVVLAGMAFTFSSFQGALGLVGPAAVFRFDVKSTVTGMPADYTAVVTQ